VLFDSGMGSDATFGDKAAQDALPMIGRHFPFPGLGNIRHQGDAFAYIPVPMNHG
jgi:hypothetical protein